MSWAIIAVITQTQIIAFSITLLAAVVILLLAFVIGHWILNQPPSPSPYTRHPLRKAADLGYYEKEQILRFLFSMREYHNRIFDIDKAAFCRDTHRIFPDSVTWYDVVRLDWSFLEKRYPGHWVSWGSLTDLQHKAILEAHHRVEGFQTIFSCPEPNPRGITPQYAYTKPGPLYVDLETKTLLGWKMVPGSDFEVMVVQKPRGIFETPKR